MTEAYQWYREELKSGRKVTIDPPARARVSLVPAKVRELIVSLEDPGLALAALHAPGDV